MGNIKFKIYTLGCKVNQYDSFKLKEKLEEYGFKFVSKNAQLAIVNSCVVTNRAKHKSQRMITKAKKENKNAKIVLVGCWPKINYLTKENLNIDLVIKESEGDKIAKNILNLISEKFELNEIKEKSHKVKNNIKARYFIKIQDGCEQFCSYCIIPFTRGKLKSRGIDEIINEVTIAVENGYREIVLCGIHLGLYGVDLKKNNLNLTVLLKSLIKIKNLGRIRLSSIEVTEISNDLIKLMTGNKKICQHLHIPLQSGSNKVLKLMNRPYSVEYFKSKIKKIRQKNKNMAVTTDVIVGFPGETKEDFEESKRLIQEINFSRLHVFPFSPHKKTKAFYFKHQINELIRDRRAEELRKIGKSLENEYRKRFLHKKINIVVEKIEKEKIFGKSEYYFDIEIPRDSIGDRDFKKGEIIEIEMV